MCRAGPEGLTQQEKEQGCEQRVSVGIWARGGEKKKKERRRRPSSEEEGGEDNTIIMQGFGGTSGW